MARYKTRRDGSRYEAWRCFEGVKNGRPHIGTDGKPVGCLGESIRNEDVFRLMLLTVQRLPVDREKVLEDLLALLKKGICWAEADEKEIALAEKLEAIEQEIRKLLAGQGEEETFYAQILDKMVIHNRDMIDLYLKGLSVKWSYVRVKEPESFLKPEALFASRT